MKFSKFFKYILPATLIIFITIITQGLNFFKNNIEQHISSLVKVPVKIGNIGINPFLVRATITNIEIGNHLKLNTAIASLNLIPLLNKRVVV
jgi:hypothetical protein